MQKLEANELKLGNYVYGHMNEICIVEQLGSTLNPNLVGYREVANIKSYGQNGQTGIELNTKWLHDLGFEFNPDHQRYENDDFPIYFIHHPDTKRKDQLICFLHNCSHQKIKYVHELQNLVWITLQVINFNY